MKLSINWYVTTHEISELDISTGPALTFINEKLISLIINADGVVSYQNESETASIYGLQFL